MRRVLVETLLGGLCAVPLLVPSPARAQASPSGSVVGRIIGPGGLPQSDVLVVVGSRQTATGENGRFRFDSIAGGVYASYLYHPERGRDTIRIPVAAGTTTGVSIEYGPNGQVSRSLGVGGLPGDGEEGGRRSGESRIVGQLVDRTTDRPIADAAVGLASGSRQQTTTSRGRFSFDSLAAGTYRLRIHHVRYGDRTAEVEVPADRTVDARIRLAPRAVEVDPVKATVDATVRRPALQEGGYYERKSWAQKQGYGHFLSAEEIANRGTDVSQVLGSVPQMTSYRGLVYFSRYNGCTPAVYLDGHKVVGAASAGSLGPRGINSLVSPVEVAGIEVYESPAATAGEFQGSDSRCGVIAIWTKRQ